ARCSSPRCFSLPQVCSLAYNSLRSPPLPWAISEPGLPRPAAPGATRRTRIHPPLHSSPPRWLNPRDPDMATVTTLPPIVREKLTAVAERIRQQRLLKGLGLLGLALSLSAAAALAADALWTIPRPIRIGLLGAWLLLGAVVTLFGLVAPLCRRLDLEGLAALVEEKYPELNERLTTTVELAGKPNADYGSPALLALLVEQTERRTSGLNFWVAFPARASTWLAG